MKARKKPVEIDFFDEMYRVDYLEALKEWVTGFGDDFRDIFELDNNPISTSLRVKTLEGTSYEVTKDDLIIRGVRGEYYPCKREIFYETYDVV